VDGPVATARAENPQGRSVVETHVSRRHSLMLLALAALWGASFMFIKVGVRELEPATLICFRLGLGTLTLLPVALVTVGRRELWRELRANAGPLILVGLLNSALPITVLAWAEKRVDSGLAAVIQASAPLFTALLALRFSRDEVVTGGRLAGLLVGFGGVGLLVGVQPSGDMLSALAITFTALCYAVAALYSARALAHVPPLVTAVGALGSATLMLVPFAIVQPPQGVPGWKVTASLLVLGILGTGLAYVLYYALLAGAGASRSILITYLVPAFALVYGSVFLDEPVTTAAVVGLALVLGGVALGTGVVRVTRRRIASSA
jgi:drug/metabolite transporter (DMT)-like permease